MKCFLLCAGFGTRMQELTQNIPKPLLTIQGKSLLEINLQFAYSSGAREFYINTHYLAEKIEQEVKKFSNYKIFISREEKEILGTAGGIKTALAGKISEEETFLLINPDSIFYPSKDFSFPRDFQEDLLLYLAPRESTSKNTELSLKKGKVFFEKGDHYYIGICIMKLKALKDVPVGKYFDLTEVFKKYSKEGKLLGKVFEGKVVDLGDKEKYLSNFNLSLPSYVK